MKDKLKNHTGDTDFFRQSSSSSSMSRKRNYSEFSGESSYVSQTPPTKIENDINAFDEDGLTPLLKACRYGNTEDVKKILAQKDVDINKGDILGMTPLHWAAFKGYTEIVVMLLAKDDINIGILARHGQPIIRCAAGNGHAKVAKLLASHGACYYNYSLGNKVIPTLGALNPYTEKAMRDGHEIYNAKMITAITFMLCFLSAENPNNKEHRTSNLSKLNRDVANIILQHIVGYKPKMFLTKLRLFPKISDLHPSEESRKRKRSRFKNPRTFLTSNKTDEICKSGRPLKRCRR